MEVKLKGIKYKQLKNLNIAFKENEITSIIGKNKSGKTTILNLIYGLNSLEDGEIKIGRNTISPKTKNKKIIEIRNNILYLIDDYKNQLFNINLLEDIKYGNDNIKYEKLEELLRLFNLEGDILQKNYLELSSGEKKKMLLISVILKDSSVLLLDNPNTGLDSKGIDTLVKILKKEKREGRIIIITSNNPEFLLQVSDKIAVLYEGKIILNDYKYKVFERKNLLDKVNIEVPNIIDFEKKVKGMKSIKLGYRDNINDLLKDIYRNAK